MIESKDRFRDELARALQVGRAYTTRDGSVFHVLKVDPGSKPGEFLVGRRPAQAKVIYLYAPRRTKLCVPTTITGMNIEHDGAAAIA